MANETNEDKTKFWNRVTEGPVMYLITVVGIVTIIGILAFSGNSQIIEAWASEFFAALAGGGATYGAVKTKRADKRFAEYQEIKKLLEE